MVENILIATAALFVIGIVTMVISQVSRDRY